MSATCDTCPKLDGEDHCGHWDRHIVDPSRVVCGQHPHAPAKARAAPAVRCVWTGQRLFQFLMLLDPRDEVRLPPACRRQDPCYAVEWGIEDVGSLPVFIIEGVRASGKRFFEMAFPGGESLTSGDVLGLAGETSTWSRFVAARGEDELKRVLDVCAMFNFFWIFTADEGVVQPDPSWLAGAERTLRLPLRGEP